MISCKRATQLISEGMERELSVQERISLGIHLFVCEFCQQFKLQLSSIRGALQRLTGECLPEVNPLDEIRIDEKQRLQSAILAALERDDSGG